MAIQRVIHYSYENQIECFGRLDFKKISSNIALRLLLYYQCSCSS